MTVIVFRPVTKAESYDPPEGVRDAAARAVAWIQEGKAGDGFTAVGRKRASDLAAGRSISVDTLRRMSSYFARHEVDRDAEGFNSGEDGFPSPGRVAWDAWGGDAGRSWVRSVFSEVEKHGSHNQQDHAGGRGANDAPVKLDSRNPDDLRAAFEQTLITPDGAEYQVKVINASGDIYSIVTGEIVDSNGERVGFFQRKLKNDQMVMNNSLLTINESHQGRGIATEFQKASERAAMSLGMEGITIDAVSDGSRAWATERFGFEFRAEPYGLRRVQRELKSSGGNAALDELAARFKTTDKTKWPRPHEILALGPIGERILDEGWNGQKPSSRVTKQVAEKMFYITVFGVSEVEKHYSHNQQDHAGKRGNQEKMDLKESVDHAIARFTEPLTSNGVTVYPEHDASRDETKVDPKTGVTSVAFGGPIKDANGEKVGEWARTISDDGTVDMTILTIGKTLSGKTLGDAGKEVQGKGLALEFHKKTEQVAREIGAENITVHAWSEGVHAWADPRFGYQFDPTKPGPDFSMYRLEWAKPPPPDARVAIPGTRQRRALEPTDIGHRVLDGHRYVGYLGDDGLLHDHPALASATTRRQYAEIIERFNGPPEGRPSPAEVLALGSDGLKIVVDETESSERYLTLGEALFEEGWYGVKDSSHVTKQLGGMFHLHIYLPEKDKFSKHGSHDQSSHGRRANGSGSASAQLANGSPVDVPGSEVGQVLHELKDHEDTVDLTLLSVDGEPVFSRGNLGISREDMPQIPKKHREQFLDETRARGVQVTDESVDPRTLIPTQSEMNAVNVAGMRASMLDGSFPMTGQRILVSSDGHVLDGHHRWAALTAIAYERPGTTIDVTRVNMPIRDLLVSAADFNDRMGIESRGLGDFGSKVRKALGLPSKFSVLVFGPLGKHYSHNQKDHAGKGGAGMEEVEKAINERIQVRAKELGVELKVGANQQEEEYFDRQNAKAVVAADISQRMSDIPVEDVAGAAELKYDPRILEDSGGAFYVRLERGQVSLVEAPTDLSGKKLENWKSAAATRGLVPSGTPEAEEYLRRAAVSQLVDNWATSSNDHHPGSLAIQDAATRHFGLSQVAPWDEMPSQKVLTQKYGAVYERFVAAQHESTQEMFKAAGITHVTVYRGLISDHPENLPGVGDAVSVISRPLSSWTTHENTANAFATNYSVVFDPSSSAGRMMKTVVPIEDVVSSAATGNGCKNEFELVLRGGVSTVSVYEPGYVFDGSD